MSSYNLQMEKNVFLKLKTKNKVNPMSDLVHLS